MEDILAAAYPRPSVFEAMLARENLILAWEKTRKNGGCAGGDGVTIGKFAASMEGNLDSLARQIRAGTYMPKAHKRVAIEKKRGGTRTLSIPSVVDRIAQGALARVMSPLFEAVFEDCSYAYRPGRSVDMAARRVTELWRQGHEWVVEADIRAYFDNVPHALLRDSLTGLVPEKPVLDLVAKWLTAGGNDPQASGKQWVGKGLPQGGPMMPHLANYYLDIFDERLQQYGFYLVRYADDFLLFARSYAAAQSGLQQATAELGRLGLYLNPEKTRISRFSDGFEFIGRRFMRDHLVEDPDGLDPEERAAISRLAELQARAEAKGHPPAPAVTRRLFGKDFDQLRAADMLAPAGDDAPLIISDASGYDDPHDEGTLFIQSEGAVLDARGGVLSVLVSAQEAWARAPIGIDRIEIAPCVVVTDAALRLSASKGLPLVWVSHAGLEMARTQTPLADRAGLHLAQAKMALDPVAGLALARILAEGRIRSARQVLMGWRQDLRRKIQSARKDETRIRAAALLLRADQAIGPMRTAALKCRVAADRSALLGLEGPALARFHRVWRRSLLYVTAGTRSRRPAVDAGNALLNYFSALLQRDIESAVRRAGLHPGIGIYHQSRDYADALVYDLMEEFRAPVVEALARQVLNNHKIKAEDFYVVQPEAAVRLTPVGRRAAIAAYRGHISRRSKLVNAEGKQGQSWRGLIYSQTRAFAKSLTGGPAYQPILRGF